MKFDNIIIASYAANKVISAGGMLTDEQQKLVVDWMNKNVWKNESLRRRSLLIDFEEVRETSRWTCVRRKQPFVVKHGLYLDVLATSKTLTGALERAKRIIGEQGNAEHPEHNH